jgi:hypothetical protein
MQVALEIIALMVVALVVTTSLAHALEMPGKLRLPKETYLGMQMIYYPGFTFAGAAEPLAIVVALVLAFVSGGDPLVIIATIALALVVAVYWIVVHPMNRFWLRQTQLVAGGETFFGLGAADPAGRDWTAIRDRWEYGHLARAILAVIAFICLAVFTAL